MGEKHPGGLALLPLAPRILISIVLPDFQQELVEQAERMNIWRNSNRI